MRRSRSVIALFTVLLLVLPAAALLEEGPTPAIDAPGRDAVPTGAGTYWDEDSAPYHEGSAFIASSYDTISGLALGTEGLACGVGSSGYLISHEVSIAREKVWDYAYADVALNGGRATLEVRDPSSGTYPGSTVVASVVADERGEVLALDLLDLDVDTYPDLHLVVVLVHPGSMTSPPVLVSWRLGQMDADMWHDPFYGLGRDEGHGDLLLAGGSVMPLSTHIPGGLEGDYYDSLGFSNYELTRLDQTIDFDWGNGAPAGGMGQNTFCIRWVGKLMAPADDTYTLYLRIDDGARLWADGELLIDEWSQHSPTEFSGSKHLTEGLHDIRIEYFENTGGALCQFRWSSSTISKGTVPHTALWGRNATNVMVSEEIVLPAGHNWDYMKVSKYGRGGVPVLVDILDGTTGTPVPGYVNLRSREMDLRPVPSGSYPSIKFRARWPEGPPMDSSVLQDWAVKWIPERTWRCEFLTDLRVTGSVGMLMETGYARVGVAYDTTDLMAFARASNATVPIYDSTVWRKSYYQQDLPTSNATDVDVADMDGDGIGDVIFTHSDWRMNATAFRGTTKGFSTAPTWTFGHSPNAVDGARFRSVVLEDLNGDGGTDVILTEDNQSSNFIADNILIYLWNASGWNSTPDIVLETGEGVFALDAGDIDGNGWSDLVFSMSGNRMQSDETYVLWGGEDGYGYDDLEEICNGAPRSIIVDFLDTDGYEDIGYLIYDTLYVHYGNSSGIDSTPDYQKAVIYSYDLTFADWNADGHRDVVTSGSSKIQIHLFPFGTSPADVVDLDNIKNGIDIDTLRVGTAGKEGLVVASRLGITAVDSSVSTIFKMGSVVSTHTIPMDGIVAVAAGEMFPMGVHTLRTAVIDVGDVGDVGDWSHLSYRMANNSPTASQSLEARLVDATTEEVLWSDTFTDAEGSVVIDPPVSAMVHPRVYLDVLASNRDDWNEMSLGHLEINWTDRVQRPPRVIQIGADDGTIYRTNSTTLRIAAEDEFDLPAELTLTVQMQTPGGSGWTSERLSRPAWDGEEWTVVFDTNREDPVGSYSFRVKATDSDMMGSEHMVAEDLVMVLNNPPGAPSIAISPSTPGTADELKCVIVRQALDRDTAHLDYEYAWFRDGEALPGTLGDTIPNNMTSKGQTWRVAVTAYDGIDRGGTVDTTVTIANSPPARVKPLGKVLMLEDDPQLTIRLADHFVDPDGDTLVYTLEGEPEVGIEVVDARLVIDLPADWHGTTGVRVNVTDGEFSMVDDLVVEVETIPDPPVVVSIGGRGPVSGRFVLDGTQDVEVAYHVVVEDVDSDSFRFGSDGRFSSFQVIAGNGTIIYRPTNAEVGEVSFNLSVLDDMNSVIVPVTVQVANVNDPPGPVTIQQPKQAMVFEHDATVLLQGACSDPDERQGQVLTFTWSSDLDGLLGTGSSAQATGLSPGEHRITLEVTDGEVVRDGSVRIVVKAAPDDNGGGGGDGPDDDPFIPVSGDSMLPIVLLILLAVVIVVAAVLYRTKLRPRKDATEDEFFIPEEERGVRIVEGIPISMLDTDRPDLDDRRPSTDMRSMMLGAPARDRPPEEDIPASPWSADELRRPTPVTPAPRPAPGAAPPRSQAAVAAEAAGWEEASDESAGVPPEDASPQRAVPPQPPPSPAPAKRAPPSADEWEEL